MGRILNVLYINQIESISMKYIILFFSLPLLFHGEDSIEWITPIEHDFGDIIHQEPAEFHFEFKNTSSDPILIDNVRTTCGCTTPDWSLDPIPPDSTSQIKVIFDAKKTGYFKKKIKVYFSNQRKGTILKIMGYVESID